MAEKMKLTNSGFLWQKNNMFTIFDSGLRRIHARIKRDFMPVSIFRLILTMKYILNCDGPIHGNMVFEAYYGKRRPRSDCMFKQSGLGLYPNIPNHSNSIRLTLC